MKLLLPAALIGALGVGCSHEAKPVVAPDEHAPLPPASGTPIGYLVDDAVELRLRQDQLDKLRAIDDDLSAKLAALDTELRTPDPVATDNRPDKPRGLGFHAGGSQGAMGMPGPPGSLPVGGGAASYQGEAPPEKQVVIAADTVNHVSQKRAYDLREAIRRALALLDEEQRVIARRVLTERGVDPDTGETTSGEPGAGPAGGDLAPLKPAKP